MDNILSKQEKAQIDSWVKNYFDTKFWTVSIFEALKNSCKRSRQNVKQLGKDLFSALTGKKKKEKPEN
jgi:hypothetical protein